MLIPITRGAATRATTTVHDSAVAYQVKLKLEWEQHRVKGGEAGNPGSFTHKLNYSKIK